MYEGMCIHCEEVREIDEVELVTQNALDGTVGHDHGFTIYQCTVCKRIWGG
jgi:hypothetical protein